VQLAYKLRVIKSNLEPLIVLTAILSLVKKLLGLYRRLNIILRASIGDYYYFF